jgi:hypothetical protein
MKLMELKSGTSLNVLPKLSDQDYQFLWIGDYWDGPISGMLQSKRDEYYFNVIDDNPSQGDSWYRRYAVIKLLGEQLEREKEIHADFQRYVGTHYDYVLPEEDRQVRPSELHHLFYDKHHENIHNRNFDDCEVVGWFDR